MSKEVIDTTEFKLPSGLPFSKGVKKGKHVYVSGAASFDENGQFIGKDDITLQTSQTLRNMLAVVKSAGGKLEDIVKVNVYLKNSSDYSPMNQAYSDFFANTQVPARTTIECKLAYKDFLVEIDAEAVLDRIGNSWRDLLICLRTRVQKTS